MKISDLVGNTPLIELKEKVNGVQIYAKLELLNPTGSVKDRAANYIITEGMRRGIITEDTVIIESSSGNFGIALAACAKRYGLRFWCVIDKKINKANEIVIRELSENVIKIDDKDITDLLGERIRTVKELQKQNPNMYWVNQYENPLNMEAYYQLGDEICNDLPDVNYVFIGVSSCGTIAGVSTAIKKRRPDCKIIAVDSLGSQIFGYMPKARFIPGIGSTITPAILKYAQIDDLVIVDERDGVKSCKKILQEEQLLVGGSSGMVFHAICEYFKDNKCKNLKAAAIFPDRGERYIDTIFNKEWCEKTFAGRREES